MEIQALFAQIMGAEILESNPDEWGILDHCPSPHALGYATTLTPAVIHQAVASQIDLLVTHHDAWDFMREERTQTLELLEAHRISHIWCHAPLDKADFGTSAAMLALLDCKNVASIAEGGGRVGDLPDSIDLQDAISVFSAHLAEQPCRVYDAKRKIRRVAVVTGAGAFTHYLAEALEHGADLFVTGETSLYLLEYALFKGVNALVYSHNYTEIFGTRNLAYKLAKSLNIEKITRLVEPHF
jgi:putative NIF3 family GTP cyclohydrolase 1 type 2